MSLEKRENPVQHILRHRHRDIRTDMNVTYRTAKSRAKDVLLYRLSIDRPPLLCAYLTMSRIFRQQSRNLLVLFIARTPVL